MQLGKPAVSPCAQKMDAMSAGIAVEEIKACKLISAYLLKAVAGRAPGLNRPDNPNI